MPFTGGTTARAVALAGALMLCCCGQSTGGGDTTPMFIVDHGLITVPPRSPLRTHLVVDPVETTAAAGGLEVPAIVEADPARVTNVLTPLSGRVVTLKVSLGEKVRGGQLLAVIASGDFVQATADQDKARDALDLARRSLQRARGVAQAGGAATKDIEAAQSAYNQAQSEFDRAGQRLVSLNGGMKGRGTLMLTAPRAGVVTALSISTGAQISDPTASLMTVANIDRVFVTANVPEREAGKIAMGSNADITLASDPDHPLHGRVTAISPIIEPDTRRQKLRIAMANLDGRLMPNMFAQVRLATSVGGGVIVPQSALLMVNDSTSVLVEVRPWSFQRRTIVIGDETDAFARVLSGLAPGDRVVVKGGVLLDD